MQLIVFVLLLVVYSSNSTVAAATSSGSSGNDRIVCNGMTSVPPSTQRQGICGPFLYFLWEGACCWYCRAMQAIKRRPELLPQLNRGDFQHFNFTQCRVDHLLPRRQRKRSLETGSDAANFVDVSRAGVKKLLSMDRSKVWRIRPTGTNLDCDCCINSCTIQQLWSYCTCDIH